MEASPSLPERKLGGSGIRNNSAGSQPSQHGAPAQRRPYTTEVGQDYNLYLKKALFDLDEIKTNFLWVLVNHLLKIPLGECFLDF